ncbi:hypothetical protein G7B40_029800 [Aetokthonos hydrillicola Thurmond2011]|uniref:Uncharacterized protein n=1 Tax=Aetokthonos hydrillicola Thurmond2011 TaxID=2712845 RepID=A0AAP5IC03_9CYAN|nr:hypothetical protein [Aetokthonos hydrillicola]MDR9898721.1 hypothetical protein [Aetokthonos hydrillicola Thurmond2011]
MLQLLYYLLHTIQFLIVPICFFCAWALVFVVASSLWTAAKQSVSSAKQMHQIPCTNCEFFTDNYRLKCTVHPHAANTEEAIDCRDYQPKTNVIF